MPGATRPEAEHMTADDHSDQDKRGPRDEGPDELGSALHVVGLAAAVVMGCALGGHWHVDPWAVTVGVAVTLVVLGNRLTGPHAALAVALTWCVITGFVTNGDAELTFDSPDVWRLILLATAAALPRAYGSQSSQPWSDAGLRTPRTSPRTTA